MNIKQNPFSLYDFLGYFIPGATGIYAYLIINQFFSVNHIDIQGIFKVINLESVGYYLPFIIAAYILGHIISFISSISIEKYSIWRYSYPSKYLLRIPHDGFWGKRKRPIQKIWRISMSLFILPVIICDFFIGKVLKVKEIYTKQLDDFLIKIIRNKNESFIKDLGIKNLKKFGDIQEIDFFRVILHYTYEHSKTHQTKMLNYVALYGFLRALSLLSIIIHWLIMIHGIKYFDLFTLNSTILLFITGILSYIFFMGFMKFYRRYTLEGFMTLIALDRERQSAPNKQYST